MKIEIVGDDSFLDGKAKMVIVSVGGKQFPFSANKKISELCEVSKKAQGLSDDSIKYVEALGRGASNIIASTIISSSVERGDILKCVKPAPREDGTELETGKEYRILDIKKHEGHITGYEVISADGGMRVKALPSEVEFVRKGVKGKKVETGYDIIKKCPNCSTDNVLKLEGENYSGQCDMCKIQITVAK